MVGDFELFRKMFEERLSSLEAVLVDGCETGYSKDFVRRQFEFTRLQLGIEK